MGAADSTQRVAVRVATTCVCVIVMRCVEQSLMEVVVIGQRQPWALFN